MRLLLSINAFRSRVLASAAALLMMAGAGCSGQKTPAAAAQAKNNVQAAAAAKVPAIQVSATPHAQRSTFTVDDNQRDPFFPKKKPVARTTAGQPAAPVDLSSLLKNEFLGVSGFGEQRIAVFRNALLERGQSATLRLSTGGQQHPVTVRCREVMKNAVVLEVQGQAQPVTISIAEQL